MQLLYRPQDGGDPLLLDQARHGQQAVRRGWRRPAAAAVCEKRRIDPVVDAVDGSGQAVGELEQVPAVVVRAGHHEAGSGDLLPQLAGLRRVDVLGMGGKAEGQPAQLGGIKRHRRRRVSEMSMQVHHPAARQAPVHEIAGLQEVAQGCRVAGALISPAGDGPSGRIAPWAAHGQAKIVDQQPGGMPQKRFRQVVHPGPDAGHALVGEALTAAAHGKDVHRNAQLFEQKNFVGDKGFGDAGIPFEHHSQHRPAGGVHGLWHRKSCRRCFMASSPVSANAPMASRCAAGFDKSSISFPRSRSGVSRSQAM